MTRKQEIELLLRSLLIKLTKISTSSSNVFINDILKNSEMIVSISNQIEQYSKEYNSL